MASTMTFFLLHQRSRLAEVREQKKEEKEGVVVRYARKRSGVHVLSITIDMNKNAADGKDMLIGRKEDFLYPASPPSFAPAKPSHTSAQLGFSSVRQEGNSRSKLQTR